MIVQHFTGSVRRGVEVWCTAGGATLVAYFAVYTIGLVLESIEFWDISPGMVPVALWIPQSAMALGLIILTVVLVDEFVAALSGREPSYLAGEEDSDRIGAADRSDRDSFTGG